MSILVCPLGHVVDLVTRRRPGRVISVLDPGIAFPELGASYAGRHLRLAFHDAHWATTGVTIPTPEHIGRLLTFLGSWGPDESLLVHCRAGIGRSTATAFVAACHRNPETSELRIAAELRRIAPLSRPNEKLVEIADALMERRGRMLTAIVETGRGLPWVDADEGLPFELASRLD
jgi:predicted protein tyrosine phosphatase